jgi:5'-methylthioadenosine phosphorylase
MTQAVLGIIGGSGIYDLPGLENVREARIASPWGEPSAPLRIGDRQPTSTTGPISTCSSAPA